MSAPFLVRPFPIWIILCVVLLASCDSSKKGLFGGKRSAHEKYGSGIEEAGLKQTRLGRLWFQAAEKSLNQPLQITVPYKEAGYFAADRPSAAGYKFNARRGDLVQVNITTVPANGFLFFIEIWRPPSAVGESPDLLEAADTSTRRLEFECDKDGSYILRIQPELLFDVEYSLTITTAPSLAFPVKESGGPKISSLWGAERDGGSRSHEGIDIVAKFRTPVVAAADGHVTRVNENELGGKVVFMRPAGRNYSLYYAHLDSQLVTAGQQVKTGDVLGLLGNTGNARTTTPHLHFGIYTNTGAVDPLPFVDKNRASPQSIRPPLQNLNKYLYNQSAATVYSSTSPKSETGIKLEPGIAMLAQAATANYYKIILPDGREGFISSSAISAKPLKKQLLSKSQRLLNEPSSVAAAKTIIPEKAEITILGQFNSYYLVNYQDQKGWIIQ
jgi:peptidoglycan LD-endopeptidase LytH